MAFLNVDGGAGAAATGGVGEGPFAADAGPGEFAAPDTGDGPGVRLVLARHGRTYANVVRELDSKPPGRPLDDVGRAQAAALAARLAAEPVTAVYSSPAVRALQTAEPVAAAHGLAVRVIDGVEEVSCGDLEGRVDGAARAEFDRVYHAWWTGDPAAHLPGGESALDLLARYLPAVEKITEGARGAVVLVSHGAAIRLAAAALIGDPAVSGYVGNTSMVVLRLGGDGWVLEHWDEPPAANPF